MSEQRRRVLDRLHADVERRALALLGLACHADGIAWQELDAQAQELLAPLEPQWEKLPAERARMREELRARCNTPP